MKTLNNLVIGAATKRARYLAQKRADRSVMGLLVVLILVLFFISAI